MMAAPTPWLGILTLFVTVLLQTAFLAFWLGRLSQRVLTVEKATQDSDGLMAKVVRLEVQMEHANHALDKVAREMEGVSRQLGNIAMGRIGLGGEMS